MNPWVIYLAGILSGAIPMFLLLLWCLGRVDDHWEERTGLRSWLPDDRDIGVLS